MLLASFVPTRGLHLPTLPASRALGSRLCAVDEPERKAPGLGGRVPRRPTLALNEVDFGMAPAAPRKALSSPQRPRGARTRISRTDAGTLLVNVPAAGLNSGSLFSGAFAAAWFSAIVPATFTGGAPVLFMAPFWLAGGLVAKQAVYDPAKASSLSIGDFAWEVKQSIAGRLELSSDGGPTEELDGASVDVASYVNGVPVLVCRLVAGADEWSVGSGLPEVELEWIAQEVNAHLESLRERRR